MLTYLFAMLAWASPVRASRRETELAEPSRPHGITYTVPLTQAWLAPRRATNNELARSLGNNAQGIAAERGWQAQREREGGAAQAGTIPREERKVTAGRKGRGGNTDKGRAVDGKEQRREVR